MKIILKTKNDAINLKEEIEIDNISNLDINLSEKKITLIFDDINYLDSFFDGLLNNFNFINNYIEHDQIYVAIELRKNFENGYYFDNFDIYKKDSSLIIKGDDIKVA